MRPTATPPPSGPDLVATDITWPVPLVVGQRVPFSFTVTNIGDTATPPDTIVDVLVTLDLDTPNVIDVGWSDNIRTPLAPGESRVQTVNGGPDGSDGLWTVNSGNHTVRAYVNSGNLPARVRPSSSPPARTTPRFASFTVTGPSDQIVFVSPFGASGGIWSMHSDGTNVHQLATDGNQPEVSRDGTKIAYVRTFPRSDGRGTFTRIWVMNADGSAQHQVYLAPPDITLNFPPNPPVVLTSPPDVVSDERAELVA